MSKELHRAGRRLTRGTFDREHLPDWTSYSDSIGLAMRWRGTEGRAACILHGGARDSFCADLTGPWVCHGCGARGGDVLAFHRKLYGLSFEAAARELGAWLEGGHQQAQPPLRKIDRAAVLRDDQADRQRKTRRAIELCNASLSITAGCIADQYLTATRGCAPLPVESDLRWLPDLRLFGLAGPGLVGRMTLALDARETTGAHITFLKRDAAGQWGRGERRYLGPKAGAVVRLWPDDAVTTGLGIAEGIESALTMAHAFRPVWACLDAGNLGSFPVLEGIESLTIAVDHDEAGLRAAKACAQRWADAADTERKVFFVMPPEAGSDLNDIVRGAA